MPKVANKIKITFRKLVNSEIEGYFLMIFMGISILWLMLTIQFLFTEETYIFGIISVGLWLIHVLCFCIFLIFNLALKKHRKLAVQYILIFILMFSFITMILTKEVQYHWSFFEPQQGLDSSIQNPLLQGYLFIEIDYSADLQDKIPFNLLFYFGFEAFKKIGTYAFFIPDDPIDQFSISFNSSDMRDYALLCNSTKDLPFAVHLLILHNSSIEGITYFLGYAPRNPYWGEAMKNFSTPGHCAAMVFFDKIITPLQFVKTAIHEVGHYLGADHSQWGIMKQGETESYLELFFSVDSQVQMNLYDKWSVEKGFFIYN